MNERQKPEATTATAHPFQFGLRELLAAPVVLALFLSVFATLGIWWVTQAVLLVLMMIGLCFRRSRNLAAAALLIWMVWLLLRPNYNHPESTRRPRCANNLKQIALALHNYHGAHGCFPPAYIADENGRPMHSWRVLILPFLKHGALHAQYDFNEPWDGPGNRKLGEIPLGVFNCPSENREPSTMTAYVAVIGPNTAWPENEPARIKNFDDGTSNTLLVVEVANSGIHWMEPRDLHVTQMAPTINPTAGQGISSLHPGGANVVFADGHVHFLPDNVIPEDLRDMLTTSGDEPIDIDEATRRRAD